MTFTNDFNEVMTEITFNVLNVQNPPDTRTTFPFANVVINDPLSYQLTQYTGTTVLATTDFAIV